MMVLRVKRRSRKKLSDLEGERVVLLVVGEMGGRLSACNRDCTYTRS